MKSKIDKEAANIAKSFHIQDRVERYAERKAFITLKDHKDNFRSNTKCRLLNPSKSEIGSISKSFLERITNDVKHSTKVNQWRETSTAIDWFKKIENKKSSRFIKFDIVDFYPSISEQLLDNALTFAKLHTTISDQEIRILKHSRKALLFDSKDIWIKNSENPMFDVTMGSLDGAEVCEIVGLYLLDKVSVLLSKDNAGLYRDDGLGIVNDANGPKLDRLRKDIIAIFKSEGLSITIETNLIETEYRKPNNDPLYINIHSNHPSTIKKELPNMINKRLSELSCDKSEFDKAKGIYEKALNESDFNTKFSYQNEPSERKNKNRKIIWFNPPHNESVKTNIGKQFLKHVKKHFPRHHKYNKIFNTNTIKFSYSCSTNMKNLIKQHNSRVLSEPTSHQEKSCNCRNKNSCPLDGNCQVKNIVYKATVTTEQNYRIYYGTAEGEFKTRYNNHKYSFRDRKNINERELSKYIWQLNDKNIDFNLKWEIGAFTSPYKCGTRRCDLCLTEKLSIIRAHPLIILNKRTELISKCRHRNKFTLARFK